MGCESGVALYDSLTHALATDQDSFPSLRDASSNEQGLSAARRDKYLMSETVRRAGLRSARQLKTAWWVVEWVTWMNEWMSRRVCVVLGDWMDGRVGCAGGDRLPVCLAVDRLLPTLRD